jgi:hypothetical protein
LPDISARIGTDLGQTTVEVKMTLIPIVAAFVVFWMSSIGLAFVVTLIQTTSLLRASAQVSR